MSLILTFLGKGGSGRTTIAIASAKKLASQGQRVLLALQDTGFALDLLLETSVTHEVQQIAPNLDAVQFKASALLERNWDEVKKLEAQYLRTPIIKDVYGQELVVLPGMDKALELNALREFDASGKYVSSLRRVTTCPASSTAWTWKTDLAMSRPIMVMLIAGGSPFTGFHDPHPGTSTPPGPSTPSAGEPEPGKTQTHS